MKKTLDPRIQIYQDLVKTNQISNSSQKNSDDAQKLQKILENHLNSFEDYPSKPNFEDNLDKTTSKIKRIQKCFKCADNYCNHRCPSYFCNECKCEGHLVRECPWKFKSTTAYDGKYCQSCKAREHNAANCITKGYLSESGGKKLRCLICRQFGHLRCDKL